MGKPVVASDLTGVRQIIHHGENGLLVEPGDSSQLAQTVELLYQDSALQQKLGRNALHSVKEFDWNLINARLLKRLDALANEG